MKKNNGFMVHSSKMQGLTISIGRVVFDDVPPERNVEAPVRKGGLEERTRTDVEVVPLPRKRGGVPGEFNSNDIVSVCLGRGEEQSGHLCGRFIIMNVSDSPSDRTSRHGKSGCYSR